MCHGRVNDSLYEVDAASSPEDPAVEDNEDGSEHEHG